MNIKKCTCHTAFGKLILGFLKEQCPMNHQHDYESLETQRGKRINTTFAQGRNAAASTFKPA